jgi:hypothetical protein
LSPGTPSGTDLSINVTSGDDHVAVLVAIDHATAEMLGSHAARRARRNEAPEPLSQGAWPCLGRIAEKAAGRPQASNRRRCCLRRTIGRYPVLRPAETHLEIPGSAKKAGPL